MGNRNNRKYPITRSPRDRWADEQRGFVPEPQAPPRYTRFKQYSEGEKSANPKMAELLNALRYREIQNQEREKWIAEQRGVDTFEDTKRKSRIRSERSPFGTIGLLTDYKRDRDAWIDQQMGPEEEQEPVI